MKSGNFFNLRAAILLPVLLFLTAALYAQPVFFSGDEDFQGEIILPREIYMLPQTVYIGDRARLVITLGPVFNDVPVFINPEPRDLLSLPDLTVNRMELEKRGENIRLLVDFVSYAPGTFLLPLLELHSASAGPLVLGGIQFTVTSILTPAMMVLSDPVQPLAAPGTGLIVYGGAGLIIFVVFLMIAALLWSRKIFGPLKNRFRKKRLLASLDQKIKILRGECEPVRRNEIFSLLAGEFREFLSFITGVDCRVLTPPEFSKQVFDVPGFPEPGCLHELFRQWDNLRFCGQPAPHPEILKILDSLEAFFKNTAKADKK